MKIYYTYPKNIKKNKIGKIIEESNSIKMPGFPRFYHATSRDYILNEIFRRVEPKGRTTGEYLREELRK
jgi:hypothetical protein